MKGWAWLAVVAIALAGCTGQTGEQTTQVTTRSLPPPSTMDWAPLACDPGTATQSMRNAQMVPGLQGDADQIARNIATAMGDEVTGPPGHYDDSFYMAWPTRLGHVIVQMGDGTGFGDPGSMNGTFLNGFYQLSQGKLAEDDVLQAVQALGADPSNLKSTAGEKGRIWQEWNGVQLNWLVAGNAGASWMPQEQGTRVYFGPFFDFLQQTPQVGNGEAITAGQAFARCHLDARGHTEAKGYAINSTSILGIAVVNGTITHLVNVHHRTVGFSPCGNWDVQWVFVDVITGAVRHSMIGPCI